MGRTIYNIRELLWWLPPLENILAQLPAPLAVLDPVAADLVLVQLATLAALRQNLPPGPDGPIVTPTMALHLLAAVTRAVETARSALARQPQAGAIRGLLSHLETLSAMLPQARAVLEGMQLEIVCQAASDPAQRVN